MNKAAKTAKELKEFYGRTPKTANFAVMSLIVGIIIDKLNEVNLSELPRLRATDRVNSPTEAYANVPDRRLRTAPAATVEGVTNVLDLNIRLLERELKREEIKRRTAAEWRLIERSYIRHADYTLPDFYDDFKTRIERGQATWADYREERRKWRRCENRWCLNVFPVDRDHFKKGEIKARNKHAKFCSSTCRTEHFKALKQYERTAEMYDNPTYLPQSEIDAELELETSINDAISRRELPFEHEHLIALENGSMKVESFAPTDDEVNGEVYECVTYNLNDLTDEEIREKGLEKYAKKRSTVML
ncbi:hypothetical protein [Fervidibacillus halotolerans]|uniref:Uncharacterized protein n=1 Tax=Fervidibacillus halotolerans TaxID=2980027 RepID=A0A9E8RZ08_9BACI|nr:hypothetical protein [Fervidibacillus halotolerans]WAA13396.1 hypothetical protein OE105_04590 [Fervidibacillus halotolerans]